MESEKINIAVIGATGLVGRELLNALAERKFPKKKLTLFASWNTAGELIEYEGEELRVLPVEADFYAGSQLIFFCTHPLVSRDLAETAARHGAVVIDASRAFRLQKEVPLVVPEINAAALAEVKRQRAGLVATPSAVATALALVLAPLERAFGIKRVIATTTHGSTAAGRAGFEEHQHQIISIFNQQELEIQKFSRQTAFNIFPRVGPFQAGVTEEEADIAQELPKILGRDSFPISVTAAFVPVFCGASAAVNVETVKPASLAELRKLWEGAAGVLVYDRPEAEEYPDTLLAMAREEVLVGRLRVDPTATSAFNFWLSVDNLRKGSALNMVQIAEAIFSAE